jgi:hypothetical protein
MVCYIYLILLPVDVKVIVAWFFLVIANLLLGSREKANPPATPGASLSIIGYPPTFVYLIVLKISNPVVNCRGINKLSPEPSNWIVGRLLCVIIVPEDTICGWLAATD